MYISFIQLNLHVLYYTEWTEQDEDQEDIHVWEDNWDDDTVEDDFSNQLRYSVETYYYFSRCTRYIRSFYSSTARMELNLQ
jgi:hypothetical protein